MTTLLIIYLIGHLLMQLLIAYVNQHSPREMLWLTALWPVIVPLMVFAWAVNFVGWDFDVVKGPGVWGSRKPLDGWPGLGVSCPWFEFLIWRKRK